MSTYSLHLLHVVRATPAKVYRAFVEPLALAQWIPPFGYYAEVHHLEPRVGGTFRISFTNFTTGHAHSFGGEYRVLEPGVRLVYTDRFEDPTFAGELTVEVLLKEVPGGCEVAICQAGLPVAIPSSMCRLGWQESLTRLGQLVEPEIPH